GCCLGGVALVRAVLDDHGPGVDRVRRVPHRALVEEVARGARADVILDRTVVDVLLAAAEVDAEHLRAAAVLGQQRLDLRAREARAERDPERLQVGPTPDPCALDREVRDAGALLLERDVPDPRAWTGVDLDDRVA